MPKYVFEVAITLAAEDDLTVSECNAINAGLCDELAVLAYQFGKRRGRISADAPFEQVTGDWLPPDENGVVRASPESRSIDLELPR